MKILPSPLRQNYPKSWQKHQFLVNSSQRIPPREFLPKKSSQKNPPKKFIPKNSSQKNCPKKFSQKILQKKFSQKRSSQKISPKKFLPKKSSKKILLKDSQKFPNNFSNNLKISLHRTWRPKTLSGLLNLFCKRILASQKSMKIWIQRTFSFINGSNYNHTLYSHNNLYSQFSVKVN